MKPDYEIGKHKQDRVHGNYLLRVAVPVVRPLASRKVVVPWLLVVAVPVVRPLASRNVLVPWLLVVTVPVVRPLASRKVVWFWAATGVAKAASRTKALKYFIGVLL
jgi:hypothetical protein